MRRTKKQILAEIEATGQYTKAQKSWKLSNLEAELAKLKKEAARTKRIKAASKRHDLVAQAPGMTCMFPDALVSTRRDQLNFE